MVITRLWAADSYSVVFGQSNGLDFNESETRPATGTFAPFGTLVVNLGVDWKDPASPRANFGAMGKVYVFRTTAKTALEGPKLDRGSGYSRAFHRIPPCSCVVYVMQRSHPARL